LRILGDLMLSQASGPLQFFHGEFQASSGSVAIASV
jgi:hypothetical protein